MRAIYMVWYVCKSINMVSIPGAIGILHKYNNVVLGLGSGSQGTDIIVKGTLSRFVEGKEYLITIVELP